MDYTVEPNEPVLYQLLFIATIIYYLLNTFLILHEQIHDFIQNYNFAYRVITIATLQPLSIYIHFVKIIDVHLLFYC